MGKSIANELSRCKQLATQRLQEPERSVMVEFIESLSKAFNADTCSFAPWSRLEPIYKALNAGLTPPPAPTAPSAEADTGTDESVPCASDAALNQMNSTHLRNIKGLMKALSAANPGTTEEKFQDMVKQLSHILRINRNHL